MKITALLPFVLIFSFCSTPSSNKTNEKPTKENVTNLIVQVNDKWQSTVDVAEEWPFWHPATYHIGNLAAYQTTGKQEYLDKTIAWSQNNDWSGAKSSDTSEWKFNYGETDEHVLFGDWQACFQVYIDLFQMESDSNRIDRALEVMSYQVSTDENEYWWWIDGLFMVMPVMPRMYGLTGDSIYLRKLHEYYSFTKSLTFDEEAGLWYRDKKYLYPKHKTLSGKKDFWSRGDGWVIAAHARTLDKLPESDPHYQEYLAVFKQMAEALKNSQQPEGYWTRSLLDPGQAPGPESSGTSFFTYGMLWGMNNGVLDKATYGPVVDKAWNYLAYTAVQEDGTLGYVQPIGERAQPDQVIDQRSTSDFGVGAFLLAATEMVNYLDNLK